MSLYPHLLTPASDQEAKGDFQLENSVSTLQNNIKPHSDTDSEEKVSKKRLNRTNSYRYAVVLAYITCVLYSFGSIGNISNIYAELNGRVNEYDTVINNQFLISNLCSVIFRLGTVINCFFFLMNYYRKKFTAMKHVSICFVVLTWFSRLYFWNYDILFNSLVILTGTYLAYASYKLSKIIANQKSE